MTEEIPTPEEEVKTTPAEGSESEEADDFESLFADEETPEGEEPDDKVARLEKTVADLKKGIAKAFSEKGREKKNVKTESNDKDDITEMFFAQKPEAEIVESDLQAIADAKYGGSILKAWKNEPWLQDKAKSLSEAKKVEEENRSKIKKPSNGTSPKIEDVLKTKEEDVEKLSPSDKIEWLRAQARNERERID